jgi:transketolase
MPQRFQNRQPFANALRALAMDGVQAANSGHPGMPMGMADIADVLWNGFLQHNPSNPHWANRDRFVISNGHGSMLLYGLLHLSGYDLPVEELKNFRQLHSKTPGHPEYGITAGVETTTGPLGQGIANGVGMALAEAVLANTYNRDGHTLINHYTYVFLGDGCLMEGISHEACSLAGTLGLGKLIAFYDDNDISIDGDVDGWFKDNSPMRFESYGWQVIRNVDGHNAAEIAFAIETAKKSSAPTLICCKTIIGFGSPSKQGKESVHGAPLGAEEIIRARVQLNWPHAPFEILEDIRNGWDARAKGAAAENAWNEAFAKYQAAYPELAAEFSRRIKGELPVNWAEGIQSHIQAQAASTAPLATRKASKASIEALAALLPELLGGSADLSESNGTDFKGHVSLRHGALKGNYINYGVREFAMSAIMNGLYLHGGFRPFGGTFLVFSDYARNALRLSALMKLGVVYVYTHDSIALGEDGPTHQPVEHLSSLRLIPNVRVWRPCDNTETAVAWQSAIEHTGGPSVLALTRQNLPQLSGACIEGIAKGGYVLHENAAASLTIIATGSEVALAVEAAKQLEARVVSVPCLELFQQQPRAYQNAVLGDKPRLAIEAGVTALWRNLADDVIGVDTFGESAPYAALMQHFGLTVEQVVARGKALLG